MSTWRKGFRSKIALRMQKRIFRPHSVDLVQLRLLANLPAHRRLKVGKVDVDSNQQVAMQYGIRGIPTLLIFKGGRVVDQIVGAVPKPHIVDKLKKVL